MSRFGKRTPAAPGSTPLALPTGMTPGQAVGIATPGNLTGHWGNPNPNKLPYQDLLDNNLTTLSDLIRNLNTSSAPQHDLDAARNLTRQESYTRGIDGPLSVALTNDSQSRVINDFQRTKLSTISSLMGLQNQIASGQQSLEVQQRWQAYLRKMQEAQAKAENQAALFSSLGSILGGGAGFLIGGPAGAGAGVQIGGSLGTLVGQI